MRSFGKNVLPLLFLLLSSLIMTERLLAAQINSVTVSSAGTRCPTYVFDIKVNATGRFCGWGCTLEGIWINIYAIRNGQKIFVPGGYGMKDWISGPCDPSSWCLDSSAEAVFSFPFAGPGITYEINSYVYLWISGSLDNPRLITSPIVTTMLQVPGVPGEPPPNCGACDINVSLSPTDVWPKGAGKDDKTTATIMVTSTNPPPEGCTVNFKVEPVENSGGHSHSGSRRKGTVTPATITIPGGSSGAASAEYKSSEVSGEEKIIAEINGVKKGETTIQVKVPGLTGLGGGYYSLKTQPSSNKHTDVYNVQL